MIIIKKKKLTKSIKELLIFDQITNLKVKTKKTIDT